MTFGKTNDTAKVHAAGMETMVRALCILVLVGISTLLGYSQETTSDYVSLSEAGARGNAPKMQVQLLEIQSLDGWSVLLARARPDCRTKSSRNIPTIGFNRVDHLVDSIGQDQFPRWDDGIGDT